MKVLFLSLLAVVAMASANESHAGPRPMPQKGYKYHTTYAEWDSGFHGYYGYSENQCAAGFNAYGSYSTCYNLRPTDNVYVIEQQESEGYHRVSVYSDEAGTQTLATYYVYEVDSVRRVERRDFYDGRVMYASTEYTQTDYQIFDMCEWNEGWNELYAGELTMGIGLVVLQGAGNTTAGAAIGIASLAFGSSSAIAGSNKIAQSSLETSITKRTYYNGRDVR